jgi:hypothetical protein
LRIDYGTEMNHIPFGHCHPRLVPKPFLVYNYGAFDFNTPNFDEIHKGDLRYFAVAHPLR